MKFSVNNSSTSVTLGKFKLIFKFIESKRRSTVTHIKQFIRILKHYNKIIVFLSYFVL